MIKSLKIILTLAVGVLTPTALSGCFTGIEKTPVIKDNSRSRSDLKPSPEQQLLKSAGPQALDQWQKGKPFIVTDGRLTYAYSPANEAAKLIPGDTILYDHIKTNVRLAGDTVTEIHLITPSGNQIHTTIESPYRIIGGNSPSLPFTIDADLVGDVRDILSGRTVWTLRPDKNGRRYQRTVISDVRPGTPDFPFLIITPQDSILMILNSKSSSARTFNNLFTLSDPRKLHPQISNANWELICNGRIAADMTREECRLALGSPDEINRQTTYSGIIERWTYEDGKYLIFTDGLLTNFRI